MKEYSYNEKCHHLRRVCSVLRNLTVKGIEDLGGALLELVVLGFLFFLAFFPVFGFE